MKQSTLLMRLLTAAIAIVAAVPAWGQAFDPKIAYTSFKGRTDSLVVANANGSNPVAIYKATSARLGRIDMAPINPAAPTVRRIAFTEAGILKVLTYEVLPSSIRAIGLPVTLDSFGAPFRGTREIDFSPDGSRILYSRLEYVPTFGHTLQREIRLVSSAGGGIPKVVLTVSHSPEGYITQPRWLNDSEFAFLRGFGLPYSTDIQLASLDANGNVTMPPLTLITSAHEHFSSDGVYRGFEGFDVARTKPALLLTVSNVSNQRIFIEYSLDNDSLFTHFYDYGWSGNFSSADAHIVYLHQPVGVYNSSDYVQRYDTASQTTVKLTQKLLIGSLDTQP